LGSISRLEASANSNGPTSSSTKPNNYNHLNMRAVLFVSPLFIQLGLSLGLERVVRRDTGNGVFNPPKTSSFLQLDLRVTLPANVSTPDGMTALAPNVEGGKATGAFEADILPVGAAYERVALNEAGENSVSGMCTLKSWRDVNSCVVLPEPIHLSNRR
jgi:hypothetical protein